MSIFLAKQMLIDCKTFARDGCYCSGRLLAHIKMAFRRYLETPDSSPVLKEMSELEKFFLSQWFSELTDADGAEIMQGIEDRVSRGDIYIV